MHLCIVDGGFNLDVHRVRIVKEKIVPQNFYFIFRVQNRNHDGLRTKRSYLYNHATCDALTLSLLKVVGHFERGGKEYWSLYIEATRSSLSFMFYIITINKQVYHN